MTTIVGTKDALDIFHKASEFCRDFELSDVTTSTLGEPISKSIDYLFEEVRETMGAWVEYKIKPDDETFAELVDGFGDVAFVAINGIYKSFVLLYDNNHEVATVKTIEVLNRICEANLAKKNPKDGTITYNDKGKVVKPEGWKAPTYGDLLS